MKRELVDGFELDDDPSRVDLEELHRFLSSEAYWADYGCVLRQPYHTEVAAGTMNPARALRSLGPKPWKVAYVEPVIRPTDGRYGENPYRFQHYLQYQVVIKPAPADILDVYFG